MRPIDKISKDINLLLESADTVKKYKVEFFGRNNETDKEAKRTVKVSAKSEKEAYDKAWAILKKKLGDSDYHFPEDKVTEINESKDTEYFVHGNNAFNDGAKISDNPYDKGSKEANEWERGWNFEKTKNNGKRDRGISEAVAEIGSKAKIIGGKTGTIKKIDKGAITLDLGGGNLQVVDPSDLEYLGEAAMKAGVFNMSRYKEYMNNNGKQLEKSHAEIKKRIDGFFSFANRFNWEAITMKEKMQIKMRLEEIENMGHHFLERVEKMMEAINEETY